MEKQATEFSPQSTDEHLGQPISIIAFCFHTQEGEKKVH